METIYLYLNNTDRLVTTFSASQPYTHILRYTHRSPTCMQRAPLVYCSLDDCAVSVPHNPDPDTLKIKYLGDG